MSKKTVLWIAAAIALILIGCFLFGGVMTVLNWDFSKMDTGKFAEKEYMIQESFENISILASTAGISLIPSQDGQVRVVCYEQENAAHAVSVKNDTLTVEFEDTRKWYEHIGIQFDSPKITVFLPAGAYGALSMKSHTGSVDIPSDFTFNTLTVDVSTADVKCHASTQWDLKIRISTGSILAENVSAGGIELSVSTGRITATDVACEGDFSVKVSTGKAVLKNVACRNFISAGSTGDLQMSQLTAQEKLSVTRSTGNVKFDRCDAGQIFVQTSTGAVSGSLLSEKLFFARTDTGSVNVPNTTGGGRCEITTDTGSIKITIEK